jgi:hypothetical protein
MDPLLLTVYESPFPKTRLGKEHDGGYVIAEIPDAKYSMLLAGGIAHDISFEEDFVTKFNVRCVAFDGSINGLPSKKNIVQFVKKNIGSENTDSVTNLHDIIAENDNIFVKMDIEGGEIPWLHSLNNDQLNKFDQIVMEFHSPFTQKEIGIFDKINNNHTLIHFHGNNCCGSRNHKGVSIPNIFECTYIHNKFFTSPRKLNKDNIPSPIDMKNVLRNDEIYISHPPFVN